MGKVLPTLARQFVTRENAGIQLPGSLLSEIKRLAHEVEVLAQACDDGEPVKTTQSIPGRMLRGIYAFLVSTNFKTWTTITGAWYIS